MSLLNEYISKRMGGKEEEALITFLKRTKDGEYAKIDEGLIAFAPQPGLLKGTIGNFYV